ncbi:tail fiber assembly protein [Cupriavidus pinatubonensis]|uniref:tail fiber assembly protein n=1 Tax=Cupriavidus pinatubonensis TaxID=248026 RepID=UPI00112AD7A7|nr:tail fiber assembly protein [Cupriavidus pinatubonensis]TPQ33413.1 phage tail protein [Cupriavidus pinatubonensis]
MLIHQYDSETGQYIHSFLADPDPRNAERWIVPAFATAVPLPERGRLQWPFFRDGAWTLLPDYRGQVLYRVSNGEPAEIVKVGITPDEVDLTTSPRPSDLHRWSGTEWESDPEAIARKERAEAMVEFEQRMTRAKAKNAGKLDALAAGLLDATEEAIFKSWAAYQLALVAIVESDVFPADRVWPPEPDERSIALRLSPVTAGKVTEGEIQPPFLTSN